MEIRFEEELVDLILDGEKDTTWRLWEERDVSPGQKVSLTDTSGERFAEAEILWVKDTTFSDLTEEDIEGHESYESKEEMYRTYEGYYDREVDGDTEVKVIKFELLR
ncbi:MAG: ASCH domain-containing protein [Candidatus Nanohaloarchaea archaeon]